MNLPDHDYTESMKFLKGFAWAVTFSLVFWWGLYQWIAL